MGEETEEEEYYEDPCSVIPPERQRLGIVGAGSIVALISVLFNLFLFIVLVRTKRHLNSPFLYLLSLAVADIFLSGAYVFLFEVNLLMDEWENAFLSSAWYSYMPYVLCCSHLAITASAFLIVAAAAERYVTISKLRSEFSQTERVALVSGAWVIAFIAKFPMLFEVKVLRNGNCTGVTTWTAGIAEFSAAEPYNTAYKFWFRNIVTVFIPFMLLFFLNLAIIRRLHRQHQAAKLFRFGTSAHRRNVRSATLLLICVTCTYLASNLLNVVLNMWEFIDREYLYHEDVRPFYTTCSDLVSFFTVCASALRLPIYYICNVKIRKEIRRTLAHCPRFLVPLFGRGNAKYIQKNPISTVRYCQSDPSSSADAVLISPNPMTVSCLLVGNGMLVYEARGSAQMQRSVGTRLDRLVLAVALGSVGRAALSNTTINV